MEHELEREDVVGWYRNPSRSSQDSLGIAYDDGTGPRIVRPDFIVFARLSDGTIAADIVDPHGIHLGDALPKLRGLARYAEEHGSLFRRIDSIAKVGDKLRVLDLKEQSVRDAVEASEYPKLLYEGGSAADYAVS